MKRGKLGTLVDNLSGAVDKLPGRPVYPASTYTNRDAVNSAFGAFFFQFPSLLRYMRELQDLEKRDNVQSLFDVKGIPSDNQIWNIVDEIEPSALNPVFNQTLKEAQRSRVIDEYRILDDGVLNSYKCFTLACCLGSSAVTSHCSRFFIPPPWG